MNRGAVRHSAHAERRRARGMRGLGRRNHRGGRRVKPRKRGSFACAEHDRQLGGASPLSSLMAVKD